MIHKMQVCSKNVRSDVLFTVSLCSVLSASYTEANEPLCVLMIVTKGEIGSI